VTFEEGAMKHRLWLRAPLLAASVFLLLAGLALASGTVTLLGYQIDFISAVDNGDGTSTWAYAVTADGDEERALSHWSLTVGSCFEPILAPADGSIYETPTTAELGCGSTYNCQSTQCDVEYGWDATTNIDGIKFMDCSPQLDSGQPLPRTHMFQFTVTGVPAGYGDVGVGVKAGGSAPTSLIIGPTCEPTAVGLAHLAATRDFGRGAGLLVVAIGLVAAGAFWRVARK
jgi:hypothetical protein